MAGVPYHMLAIFNAQVTRPPMGLDVLRAFVEKKNPLDEEERSKLQVIPSALQSIPLPSAGPLFSVTIKDDRIVVEDVPFLDKLPDALAISNEYSRFWRYTRPSC
jgi:hypothetical protein